MRIVSFIQAKKLLAGDIIPGGILVVVVGGQQLDKDRRRLGVANVAEVTCISWKST